MFTSTKIVNCCLFALCLIPLPSLYGFQGSVSRAQFSTAIVEREPADRVDTLSTATRKLFYFTELRGLAGQKVTHRWIYGGKTIAAITFDVNGARWRVHSSKNLLPEWTGTWTVEVVDSSGHVLHTDNFVYTAVSTAASDISPQKPDSSRGEMPPSANPPDSSSMVKRALFTTDVVDHEPVDELDSLTTATPKVFFFTELRNMQGKTVTHRWIYAGEIRAEKAFAVQGPRWRVFSSKNLIPAWAGTWQVQVVDENGDVLTERSFIYRNEQAE